MCHQKAPPAAVDVNNLEQKPDCTDLNPGILLIRLANLRQKEFLNGLWFL